MKPNKSPIENVYTRHDQVASYSAEVEMYVDNFEAGGLEVWASGPDKLVIKPGGYATFSVTIDGETEWQDIEILEIKYRKVDDE